MNALLTVPPASHLPPHGSFSGHETFPFRYAWLKKGIDGLSLRPDIFQSEEAMVELGVGKNMVRSIRYWCLATQIIEEGDFLPGSRIRRLAPTSFGRSLFLEPGYDPYLEDDASLWLLHWHLTTNSARATTWYWAFHLAKGQDFTREGMTTALTRAVEERNWSRVSEASLKADVACFLRTYVPGKRGVASTLEETLDCPLINLNLIAETGADSRFRFVNGSKIGLPAAVFAYALIAYWQERFAERKTLSVREIVHGEGSPGRAFRLDEEATLRYLERLEALTKGALRFSDSIEQRQVLRLREITKEEALDGYYVAP